MGTIPICRHIFFARPPLVGKVKTRLASFLGAERACNLYSAILSHNLQAFQQADDIELLLFSAEAEHSAAFWSCLPQRLRGKSRSEAIANIYWQEGADLGERLAHAFFHIAKKDASATPILIAGSDYPRYQPTLARAAIQLLAAHECVIGRSADGGYYLIGLQAPLARNKKLLTQIFSNLPWSGAHLCNEQLERLNALGIRSAVCASEIEDIDVFADFARYRTNSKNTKWQASPLSAEAGKLDLDIFWPNMRVVLPVLNEAQSLPIVLRKLHASGYFDRDALICADNGSVDESVSIAKQAGAQVSHCARRGYGSTCLAALQLIRQQGGCEVVLFVDADGADDLSTQALAKILAPCVSKQADFCLGARQAGLAQAGALLPHARFGNWLATRLIRLFWGARYNDLGPLRAIRWSALENLQMDDPDFGWTIQMQIRAAKKGLRCQEIPVAYHKRRAGKSKVSANIWGSIQAAMIILRTIWRELAKQ